MKNTLSKVPIIRILLPFLAGIIIAYNIQIPNMIAIIAIILSIMALFIIKIIKTPLLKISYSYIKSFPIIIMGLGISIINTNISKSQEIPTPNNKPIIAHAEILNIIDNDYSTNAEIKVTSIYDTNGIWHKTNEKILAWIEGNNYTLSEGCVIAFNFSPQKIINKGNPEEFDYAQYMKNKGFIRQVFIKQDEYKIIDYNNNIFTIAKTIKREIINLILSSQLVPEIKTFFITILIGESEMLNQETRELFSSAGISHILALSGLHIGIIAFIFSLILYPLDLIGKKKLRFIFSLCAIIIYAFITGLSISVLRATIMISFVLISKILHRNNSSLNALFAAALIILIINPLGLFDISFQLSFTTVLFILLLSKKTTWFTPKKRILNYISSLITISLITSAATIWLTIYYFNQVSFISFFTNIIILPLLPLIVGIGLIYICLLAIGLCPIFITHILNYSYKFIHFVAKCVTDIPYSNIDFVYLSGFTISIIYIALLLIVIYVHRGKIFYIYCSIIFIICSIDITLIERNCIPQKGYIIWNDNSHTPILTFQNNKASLLTPNDSINHVEFMKKNKKFFSKYQINQITQDTSILCNNNIIYKMLGDKKIGILYNNSIKYNTNTTKINIDYLIISRGFYGNISDVLECFNPDKIILSGNLHHKKHDELVKQCTELNIKYHSIKYDGAISHFIN